MGRRHRALGLCAAAAVLSAPAGAEAAWHCRHAMVRAQASGAPIVGIEDIAVDAVMDVAYLSAYDRRAGSPGAIYRLDRAALDRAAPTAAALGMVDRQHFELRPHGIALAADGTLYAVNRRDGGPVVERFAIAGGGLAYLGTLSAPSLCRPNDLAPLADGRLLATNDAGHCGGWRATLETVFNLAGSYVMAFDGGRAARFAAGFRFANGIAARGDEIFVAATRDNAIFRLSATGERLGRIDLPGAPDNLNWGSDGALYATGFASLIGYARFRRDPDARAAVPTRVYRIDPASGAVETLALDPAELPAGGSVAVRWDDWLLVGAGYDAGLGICRRDGAS